MNKILYFSNTWPRSQTSAACERVFGLIEVFRLAHLNIDFICAAKKHYKGTEGVKKYKFVYCDSIDPNNNEAVQHFLRKLKDKFEASVFDTFIAEELYSHYIHRLFPKCLKILDTQDLHSLRKLREQKYMSLIEKFPDFKDVSIMEILAVKPTLEDPYHAREMASIFRSDYVFLTSDYEKHFLETNYGLKNTLKTQFYYSNHLIVNKDIGYRTYFLDGEKDEASRGYHFERRKDFVWLGNFKHAPNLKAVELLISEIWPKIRTILPEAELHIYGSDFPKKFEDIEHNGIRKKNLMQDLKQLSRYRVLLAPIFFGAGIKGKITDAWFNFLPVVTTPIGAEGLFYEAVDDDFQLERLSKTSNDERFIKPDVEILKTENTKLVQYYKYQNETDILNSDFKFGGIYTCLSLLIRC